MYRILVIGKDQSFLDQASRFLTKLNKDIRVITLDDPKKIDEVLQGSLSVDAFLCDHCQGKLDAFELFIDRTKHQDYRPFIVTVQKGDENEASRALELKVDHYIIRDKPVMNLYMEVSSKIIMSVESWRVAKERELNEKRLNALVRLAKMYNSSFSEILHYVLEESVKLTQSQMGYFALYDQKTRVLTMHAWSQAGMEACRMREKPMKYNIDDTGVWGEPIRLKQSVIVNDYAAKNIPGKKGTPMGHAPLNRLLMVPILHNGEVLGTAGVANKKDEYNDGDRNQLFLLMDGFVNIHLERMIKREAQMTERRFKEVLNFAPIGIAIFDKEMKVLECNEYAKNMFDLGLAAGSMNFSSLNDNTVTLAIKDLTASMTPSDSPKEADITLEGELSKTVAHIIVSPVSGIEGELSGYIAVIEDITKIINSNHMLEEVVNHINILDLIIYAEMSKTVDKARNAVANLKINPEKSIKVTTLCLNEIEDSIAFSKQFRNVGILDPEWQILSEVVTRATWSFSNKDVTFDIKVDGLKVLADSALQTVFHHLISNSIEHGGNVTKIVVRFKIVRGELTIIYSDNGVGVPLELKEELTGHEITDNARFGMFLINSVIIASKFTIRETGVPGEGATFEISVPSANYAMY